MVEEQVEDFVRWLETEKGLKRKSARDIVSRLRRAEREGWISGAWEEGDLDELFVKLKRSPSFSTLSPSVKSQVKAALKHWKDFLSNRRR